MLIKYFTANKTKAFLQYFHLFLFAHPPQAAVDFSPSLTAAVRSFESTRKRKSHPFGWLSLAEKERFELSNRFWRLHDFQSCALDQLRDFSVFVRLLILFHCDSNIIPQNLYFVNTFLKNFYLFYLIFEKLWFLFSFTKVILYPPHICLDNPFQSWYNYIYYHRGG